MQQLGGQLHFMGPLYFKLLLKNFDGVIGSLDDELYLELAFDLFFLAHLLLQRHNFIIFFLKFFMVFLYYSFKLLAVLLTQLFAVYLFLFLLLNSFVFPFCLIL